MKWSTITKMCSTLGDSFRFVIISNEVKLRGTSWRGGGNYHRDHWGLFLLSFIMLTPSTVLDCSVDIFVDSRSPELIRDKTLGSLLALMASITVATIYSSPSVCSWHNEAFHFFNLVLRLVPVV